MPNVILRCDVETKVADALRRMTSPAAQLSNDSHKHYKAQFAFGVNLPVGGVIEALKKASSK